MEQAIVAEVFNCAALSSRSLMVEFCDGTSFHHSVYISILTSLNTYGRIHVSSRYELATALPPHPFSTQSTPSLWQRPHSQNRNKLLQKGGLWRQMAELCSGTWDGCDICSAPWTSLASALAYYSRVCIGPSLFRLHAFS